MNFIQLIKSKPLSPGAIFFFWMPLSGILLTLAYFGLRYWWISLGCILFIMAISSVFSGNEETRNILEDEEIQSIRDDLVRQKILLLESMGHPKDNGRWNAEQERVWKHIRELDRKESEFLSRTEVVNLVPHGHNVGRIYKR